MFQPVVQGPHELASPQVRLGLPLLRGGEKIRSGVNVLRPPQLWEELGNVTQTAGDYGLK